MNNKEYFMNEAIKLAKKSLKHNDVPVGAVIVKNNKIIAKGFNKRNKKNNALYHAEIIAINNACKHLKDWVLEDCEMYVTLEPCVMCSGAIIQSRIKKVYYGALSDKNGTVSSIMKIFDHDKFTHKVESEGQILEDECKSLIQEFFKKLRTEK
ncbi:MAG: tRNA adenosine(34) deaminase TadA [archaeon]|nr:tRNA adenosine(34) deaminase TadA [archaeon]